MVELREFESFKLDAMQRAAWNDAVSGDMDAIKVVLQVHDRKVRLFGLAARWRCEWGRNLPPMSSSSSKRWS